MADLQLRGRTGPVRARVHWPVAPTGDGRPALLVFLPAGDAASGGLDQAEPLCRELGAGAGIVVLSVSYRSGAAFDDAVTATRWSADHATELGADAGRLVVGGEGAGAGLAAVVALHARDEGWPPIARQVLIRPRLDIGLPNDAGQPAASPLGASSVEGVAPATIVTTEDGPRRADARRYAARLRQAGVPVDEGHLTGAETEPMVPAGDEVSHGEVDAAAVAVAEVVSAVCRSLEEAGHD